MSFYKSDSKNVVHLLNDHSPELNSPIFSDFTAESSIGRFKEGNSNNKIKGNNSNKNKNNKRKIPQKTPRHLIRPKTKKNKINILKYKSNDDIFKPSKQIPFHPSLKQRSSAAISYAQASDGSVNHICFFFQL